MDNNEASGHTFARDEAEADVEGHIRKAHTIAEGPRVQSPVEAREASGEDDGPDVEGHGWKF